MKNRQQTKRGPIIKAVKTLGSNTNQPLKVTWEHNSESTLVTLLKLLMVKGCSTQQPLFSGQRKVTTNEVDRQGRCYRVGAQNFYSVVGEGVVGLCLVEGLGVTHQRKKIHCKNA